MCAPQECKLNCSLHHVHLTVLRGSYHDTCVSTLPGECAGGATSSLQTVEEDDDEEAGMTNPTVDEVLMLDQDPEPGVDLDEEQRPRISRVSQSRRNRFIAMHSPLTGSTDLVNICLYNLSLSSPMLLPFLQIINKCQCLILTWLDIAATHQ